MGTAFNHVKNWKTRYYLYSICLLTLILITLSNTFAGKGGGVGSCDVFIQEGGTMANRYDKCNASLLWMRNPATGVEWINVEGSLKAAAGSVANRFHLEFYPATGQTKLIIGPMGYVFNAAPPVTVRYRVRDPATNYVELSYIFNASVRADNPAGVFITGTSYLTIEGVATK